MTSGGVFILDKPSGITSQRAVLRVARLLGAESAGHTGTLDPMATGVLPILLGRAAKAAEYIIEQDKHYDASMTLGYETDTEDSTGRVLSRTDRIPGEDEVYRAASAFVGTFLQTPPMYSAVRVGGRRLMEIARSGGTAERTPRSITVFSMNVKRTDGLHYTLSVHCSKGTYIRTLCADIGRALGCGAVMSSLRRTEAAGFDIEHAHTLEELEQTAQELRAGMMLPLETAVFSSLDVYTPPDYFGALIRHGCAVSVSKLPGAPGTEGVRVRLYDGEGFWGIGETVLHEDKLCLRAVKHFRL